METGLSGVERNCGFIGLITGACREVNNTGTAAGNVSIDEQRLRGKEVRQMLRIDICHIDACKRKLHIGEHGTLNAFKEPSHLAADFIVVSNVSKGSAAKLRHLGGEEEIGLAANGNRIKPRVAEITVKRGKDFFFIAKVAISKKNDMAQVAGRLRFAHEVKQRRQHLSAAARLQALHVMARS